MNNKIEITKAFKVKRSNTLLNYLMENLNTSRNNCKMLLSNHLVMVNGDVVTKFDFNLAKEDEIKILKNRIDSPKNKEMAKPRMPRMEIIYEDDDFIAINKPNGVLSVESDKDINSCYSVISKYLSAKGERPYIIHRIDKETSGVLVFAKNAKIHSILRLHWNDYVKNREYHAIVEGCVNGNDTIINYLTENKNNIVYSTNKENGVKAITHYKSLKSTKDYSLLDIHIDTGRKNQIRVTMMDMGHPVVGDDKYQSTKNPIKRLGLHATRLELVNPLNNELMVFNTKYPTIFDSLFKK
ncbi:MAG: RluA family pseudouridine synthase [Acholeplasmatales bacterium]|nr:RluA family pseudouridine synthase [Acholeplasmatales bacterium]